MTIEFSCPECGKPLSTSDDKAGRAAKCPGCSAPLTVPGPSQTAESGLGELRTGQPKTSGLSAEGGAEDGLDRVRNPCPVCGELILAEAKVCRFCGEQFAETQSEDPSGLRADFGLIWEKTWEVFQNNMGLAVGLGLVVALINFVAALPQNALNLLNEQGRLEPAVYFPALLVSLGLTWGVQFWTAAGYAHCMLKLARGNLPAIGELFAGGRWFWPTVGSGIVFGLATGLGTIACVIPGILVALRLWPYLYFIVDEDDGVTDSLNRAFNLTQNQYGLGLLLGVCYFGLHLGGVLLCCVGILFTSPLATLLVAMTYLALRVDYRQSARGLSQIESGA